MTKNIISYSVAETIALGERIGQHLRGGEVLALIGELGTGKTHLIKGLAQGLGVAGADDVTSPTFTLVNELQGRLKLYHVDAYRLENFRQLEALGFDEFCHIGSVVVVEWADRVWDLLAEYEPICIRLEHIAGERRRIVMENLPQYL
ncbi:MAG: tRNA (adenosine(37)-N6)-threonylcarbamoyltransferase complex ATPase subunit type 1 TsaE [Sedimentisphaerales bacterium]|nr:tRNA (adenosine(37)-N6)-threonylcarbamoyltransferase complex ATPase subunit type 1 TsaE [Sedimentisphaerales bacterium]